MSFCILILLWLQRGIQWKVSNISAFCKISWVFIKVTISNCVEGDFIQPLVSFDIGVLSENEILHLAQHAQLGNLAIECRGCQ